MLTNPYNPDVLTCLANLSSDEVFTPPKLANEILDQLPKELWSDRNAKFLDPFCKSGVFLREIAKRLIDGLAEQIPDQTERVNHIFKNQLYGIAITELTSLLARRSLYCSKIANGQYSICEEFTDAAGNIRFERVPHAWKNGRCSFCGASQENYEREEAMESHAYEFIHTQKPEEIFNMKFDVIIGNPPYQLSDGGFGRSAGPIYNKFVQQAKKLEPRFLTMIIPSRWFAGGKGLDDFRAEMINDSRIQTLVDYANASECFPGVDLAGGVCYFLWNKEYHGQCTVTHRHKNTEHTSIRALNEFSTFIRNGQAVPILRKVNSKNESKMSEIVSSRKPFGLPTNARPYKTGDLTLKWNNGSGPFPTQEITTGKNLINKWKVITSKTSYDHAGQPNKDGKRRVLSIIEILPPKSICTETYIVAGSFTTKTEAQNLCIYLKSKFLRFLVSQLSFSQDITKDRFSFVPQLDMQVQWDDDKLYERYALNVDEKNFIEEQILPME
jgi:site-specific DNA-methyltransferase (adenine-specific)